MTATHPSQAMDLTKSQLPTRETYDNAENQRKTAAFMRLPLMYEPVMKRKASLQSIAGRKNENTAEAEPRLDRKRTLKKKEVIIPE